MSVSGSESLDVCEWEREQEMCVSGSESKSESEQVRGGKPECVSGVDVCVRKRERKRKRKRKRERGEKPDWQPCPMSGAGHVKSSVSLALLPAPLACAAVARGCVVVEGYSWVESMWTIRDTAWPVELCLWSSSSISTCACVCICVCVCLFVCACVFVYVCESVCVCICVCVCVCV